MNINEFSKSLASVISEAIVNEMAKGIGHRTIDRKVQLSVASTCSRHKADEAEFIRPLGRQTKQDLIDRYVFALIVMRKPCPRTEADIERLKTFKLVARRAIELGATMKEIQDSYAVNSGTAPAPAAKPAIPVNKPAVPRPVRKSSSGIPRKYKNELDKIVGVLPKSMYKDAIETYVYGLPHNKAYQDYLKKPLMAFAKKLVKGCATAADLERKLSEVFSQFAKATAAKPGSGSYMLDVWKNIGEGGGWMNPYTRYLKIHVNAAGEAKVCEVLSYSSMNKNNSEEPIGRWFEDMLKSPERYRKGPSEISLVEEIAKATMVSFIPKHLIYLRDNAYAEAAKGAPATLKKYAMNGVTDYFTWCRQYIPQIMKANPQQKIRVKYGDWSGEVEAIAVYKGEVCCDLYLQSGSSDTNDADSFRNVFANRNRYSFRWVDKSGIDSYRDPDDAIFLCTVDDMDELAKTVYDNAKSMVEKGMLV